MKVPEFFEFLCRILPRILLRKFPRIFRGFFVLRFVGNWRPRKKRQKSPPFFQCIAPRQTRKEYIHFFLLESRQSNINLCRERRSGVEILTRSSSNGLSNRAILAHKNRFFASRLLLLGIGFLEAPRKANFSFKSTSPKPHLNRTGSVFQ